MVYFKRHILCATPLTPVCLQSFYKAITPIILKNSCYYIRISAFYFSVPAEPIIVKQYLSDLAVFLRIFHNKIFSLTVLLNDSADSCPVLSGKGLEHTVSHYIVEVVEDRHIVCEPVVIVQSTDFCVVLV